MTIFILNILIFDRFNKTILLLLRQNGISGMKQVLFLANSIVWLNIHGFLLNFEIVFHRKPKLIPNQNNNFLEKNPWELKMSFKRPFLYLALI